MATLRQIEASKRNGALSNGPVSDIGKSNSRKNSLKHGLCARQEMTEEEKSEFAKAWDEWRPYYDLPRPDMEMAFHRMILASIRLKRCHVDEEKAQRTDVERATTRWDEDRRARADAMGRQLARHPESVAKRLEHTKQGVEWLIERWGTLAARLEEQGEWTEAQVNMVHDLHGLPPALRPVTPNFVDAEAMVAREIARLEGLKVRSLDKLDALEREDAMHGSPSELSAAVRRLRRYERALQREYDEQAAFLHKERTWPPNERKDRWTCPGCGQVPAPVYEPVPEWTPEPEPEPEPETEADAVTERTQREPGQDGLVEHMPEPDRESVIVPRSVPNGVQAWTRRESDGVMIRTKVPPTLSIE